MKVKKGNRTKEIHESRLPLFTKYGWSEVVETSNQLYKCEKCGKEYKTKKAYEKHIQKCEV